MPQGQWATQQSASNVAAVTALEQAMVNRGYVPQAGNNEAGLVQDAINALLNCIPQSIAVALTPVAVAAATTAEQTFTPAALAGLAVGDTVVVTTPAAQTAGTGIVGARVSAAGTLAITFVNATAGSLTPASGTYIVRILRS